MTKAKNIPILRFPGFVGEWGENKLGGITKINQGLQIAIADRQTVPSDDAYFYITNEFLRPGNLKKYYIVNPPKSVICNENDILMTRTGNTGQVVTGVSGAFHNNFFKIKHDNSINKNFLVYFLRSAPTQNMISRLAGTSTIPDLNHSDFYRIKISLPQESEQKKIAGFLTVVDEQLAAQGERIELMKKYKKGIMQKIFPAAGETNPTLRFKNENEKPFPAWEEKTLGHVVKFLKGKGISKTELAKDGENRCILYGELYTKYDAVITKVISNTNISKSELNFSEAGDVLMPTSGESSLDIATASVVMDSDMALGGDIMILRGEFVGTFLAYYIRSSLKVSIARLAQGNSVVHLYPSSLQKLTINKPIQLEQKKIADFLTSIDDKIKEEERKLMQANQIKKSLLQQMFV